MCIICLSVVHCTALGVIILLHLTFWGYSLSCQTSETVVVTFLGVTRLECRKSVPKKKKKKEIERTLHVAILTIKSVL